MLVWRYFLRTNGQMTNRINIPSIFLISILLLLAVYANAQEKTPIDILGADALEFTEINGEPVRKMIGKVKLRQGEIYLMCDSAYFYTKRNFMSRQSISFTEPNDKWLKDQVDSKEYSSKSELVNDLIRQARKQQSQIDWIKAKIKKAEKSGFSNDSKEDILAEAKARLNGQL